MNDKNYGNNNLFPIVEEYHGTHVSGIIAADRENEKGIKGIADNAVIMPIRLSSKGYEHDKDVALAIRYAVDNGAKVINMSIGKAFSLYRNWVFDAIKYAEKNDVLIVVVSGNNSQNTDKEPCFPNDTEKLKNEITKNVILVGASAPIVGEKIVWNFSNYGKNNVDIFAPGYEIYSVMPNNKYEFKEGTSMASPIVSGIATLVRSYYPKLTALQVKEIILQSGTKIKCDVIKPGRFRKKIAFSELCKSGSIANAYNAVRMADKLLKE